MRTTSEERCKLYDRHHRQTRGRHDNIIFSSNVYVTSQPPVGHVTLRYSSPAADDTSTYIGPGVVCCFITIAYLLLCWVGNCSCLLTEFYCKSVCIVQSQLKTYSENPNCRNFRVWNSHRQRGHNDYGNTRCSIFGGSVRQLYRTSYAVRSAFLTTATRLVLTYHQRVHSFHNFGYIVVH